MIGEVLKRKNLYKAYRQVVQNKGSAGIDKMTVYELANHLEANRDGIITSILSHAYAPSAIKSTVRRCGRNTKRERKNPNTRDSNGNRPLATAGSKPSIGHKVRSGSPLR